MTTHIITLGNASYYANRYTVKKKLLVQLKKVSNLVALKF